MKIGVIGAMAEEIRALRDAMTDVDVHQIHGMTVFEGKIDQQEMVLIQSGIGKVNATISVAILVERFKVSHVINTGTAGSLDPGLRVGDVVIAHSLAYHDVDVTAFGHAYGQMSGMPAEYYPNLEMVRLAQEVARQLNIEPVVGQIVSGDQFIQGQKIHDHIMEKFPKARACEMESTAIAQACQVMDVPYAIIRCMSDQADGQANVSFDEFVIEAGQKSAVLVQYLITAMGQTMS